MSELERLIQQHCPNGIPHRKIGEVMFYEQPSKYIVSSTNYSDEFETPVLTAGQTFILGYTDETNNICDASKESPVIIFDDFTGAFKWVDFPFKVKSSAMKILTANENTALLRYIYHIMGYLNFSSDEHKRLWISIYSEFEIPVPPIEVQREIVRILDNYTELTAELTAKLQAELTARKKQYEYYRDMLLERNTPTEKVALGSVCEVYDGTHQTPEYTESGIPFVSVEDINNLSVTKKFISPEAYAKFKVKPRIGDVFMTRITAGVIGKCAIVDSDDDLAYYVSLALLRPNRNVLCSRYLKHYLESGTGKVELAKRILWNATPTKINKDDIGKLFIALPPLDVQERLVRVLDNFDAICTDLTIGLPAEIEARQKQYEYYRNQLLTFKEKAN